MSASNTDNDGSAAAIGAEIAKDIVALAGKVADEVMAGFESAAHRSNRLAATIVSRGDSKDTKDTTSTSTGTEAQANPSTSTTLVDSHVVSQLFDLAQQALKLAGDTAGRVLQTGLGPIEKVFDRDSHRHDDVWVTLSKAAPGGTSTGSFTLENAATSGQGLDVTLTMVNPLASMKGSIPTGQVRFVDNPVHLEPAKGGVPSATSVRVEVDVPLGTPPGKYLGIVRSAEVHDLTIVLGLDVG